MAKSLKNVKNEKCTLKDLEYGEKTENHGKWVFLDIFHVLKCVFLIFRDFQFSCHIPGPSVGISHFSFSHTTFDSVTSSINLMDH